MRVTLFILNFKKPLENPKSSFLFRDENPVINNLLDVKKLSAFVTNVTTKFYILERKSWVFRFLNLQKFSYLEEELKQTLQRYNYLQFLLSCFYRNQIFSTTFSLQRENFQILINSLHRELWRRRIFCELLVFLLDYMI